MRESVRSISDGSYDCIGEDFPFENIKARLESGKSFKHLQEINHAKDTIGRLAILYYYLDTVLGPLVYSEQYQLQLFDLCVLDASLPPKETEEIKALLTTYIEKRKMLYDFISVHFAAFDDVSQICLTPMIEMIKVYLDNDSPLMKGFTSERISTIFSTKRDAHPRILSLYQRLSIYAEKRNQTGNLKYLFLGGHSKATKLRAVDKITAYCRFEMMSLTQTEISALLEKGSELREALSDFLFSFPGKAFDLKRDKKKITQLEHFPVLDEGDTPHNINFRF